RSCVTCSATKGVTYAAVKIWRRAREASSFLLSFAVATMTDPLRLRSRVPDLLKRTCSSRIHRQVHAIHREFCASQDKPLPPLSKSDLAQRAQLRSSAFACRFC